MSDRWIHYMCGRITPQCKECEAGEFMFWRKSLTLDIETELREQIAKEIEAKCDAKTIEDCNRLYQGPCAHHNDANIARGK